MHLAAVIEILQSIRQSDMSPILGRIYSSEGGSEALDTLMKYMYVAISVIVLITSRTQGLLHPEKLTSIPRRYVANDW